ncbi:LysR family transcriptional regulator [Pigmentiphaga sp. YJ18]|uniref:LysR family transcriptional regulator n=1 Tax=Pigmentiphaga sp. YJ18 TaxID=3134907 RepID=UPI003111BCE9
MDWIQRLRVRQLYVLVSLHETANLSLTAARMHMTQPALSKWLRELETDLGVELFERHSRGLVPTRFCDTLVGHARTVLGELERTGETLRAMSDGSDGQLLVGTTPIGTSGLLPACLGNYRRLRPGICTVVHENSLEKLLPQLKEGRLDCIVSRIEAPVDPAVVAEPLQEEGICVVASRGHPLARLRKVTWAQARDYPWAMPQAGTPLRREMELALAAVGEPLPRAAIEASSVVLIASLLQDDEMLAVMSDAVVLALSRLERLKVLPLALGRRATVGVLRRAGTMPTPVLEDFLSCLRQAARAGGRNNQNS